MKQQSITTLPPSPEAERHSRMIKYTIAMSIRVACIFAMLFVEGWWLAVCAAGAIFLPYVAVVLANVSGPTRAPQVLRPGGLVPLTQAEPTPDTPGSDDTGTGDSRPGQPDTEHHAESETPHDDERGAA
ncbi:DUF3099 domain-containing protein [Agromyces sp. NPDC058484]|uniref:DUF3099 domain-containing protein n=1 Tax=Agromyces sp. NPDC058484 TaxID=3346524 RepID=UPI003651A379